MLTILTVAAMNCSGIGPLAPPASGSSFTFEAPRGFYVHEQIDAASRSGIVSFRNMVSREVESPGPSMGATAQSRTTFMGLIMVESGGARVQRQRTIPSNLLDQLNELPVGATLDIPVRHRVTVEGETHAFTEMHQITFMGCGIASADQGTVRTRQYQVNSAAMRGSPGGMQVVRAQKRVDLAVGLGWIAYADDGYGAIQLVQASARES